MGGDAGRVAAAAIFGTLFPARRICAMRASVTTSPSRVLPVLRSRSESLPACVQLRRSPPPRPGEHIEKPNTLVRRAFRHPDNINAPVLFPGTLLSFCLWGIQHWQELLS